MRRGKGESSILPHRGHDVIEKSMHVGTFRTVQCTVPYNSVPYCIGQWLWPTITVIGLADPQLPPVNQNIILFLLFFEYRTLEQTIDK